MITIISKQIIALRGSPRIYQEPFDRLQEWLSGTNPMSSSTKNHDSGKRREVFPDLSPAGPEEISKGQGNKGAHDNVGSGYDKDVDLFGGRADDETGPGNNRNSDPEQTFTDHMTSDLAFKNDYDTSSTLSPLNEESRKRDRNSNNYLMSLQRRPKVQPKRVASWKHTFLA